MASATDCKGFHEHIKGSASETPGIHRQWLGFIERHLCTYELRTPGDPGFAIDARSCALDGFMVGRFTTTEGASRLHRSQRQIGQDAIDRFILYMSVEGELEMEQFGRNHHYSPGTMLLVSTAEPLAHTKLGGNDTLCFGMPRAFVEQRLTHAEDFCARPAQTEPGMGRLVQQTLLGLEQSASAMEEQEYRRAAALVGDLVLLALTRSADLRSSMSSVRSANLARAKRIMRSQIANSELSVSDVARRCGFSVSYLHNLFRDDGRTVSEYLKRERLQLARQLLETPPPDMHTVTDVSLACGFSNMSQFSTAFKHAFGLSPRDILYRH